MSTALSKDKAAVIVTMYSCLTDYERGMIDLIHNHTLLQNSNGFGNEATWALPVEAYSEVAMAKNLLLKALQDHDETVDLLYLEKKMTEAIVKMTAMLNALRQTATEGAAKNLWAVGR